MDDDPANGADQPDEDVRPGDDGRPLGNLTGAVIADLLTAAASVPAARFLRELAARAAKVAAQLPAAELAGRSAEDIRRACVLAADTVRQILSEDLVDEGLRHLGELADSVRRVSP